MVAIAKETNSGPKANGTKNNAPKNGFDLDINIKIPIIRNIAVERKAGDLNLMSIFSVQRSG